MSSFEAHVGAASNLENCPIKGYTLIVLSMMPVDNALKHSSFTEISPISHNLLPPKYE